MPGLETKIKLGLKQVDIGLYKVIELNWLNRKCIAENTKY